jgi:hypothetical protein
MIMDPAMVHHGEAVDKLARKLGLPQVTRKPHECPPWAGTG